MKYRLRPGAKVLWAAPDRAFLTFANHTAELNGASVVATSRALIEAFDTSPDLEASVAAAAASTGNSVDFVRFVLDVLVESHCLVDDGLDRLPLAVGPVAPFLASVETSPGETAAMLGATNVLVAAPASAADALIPCLDDSGMHVDVRLFDRDASPEAIVRDNGAGLETPAMIACWGFSYESAMARAINDIALTGRSVLFGVCEGMVGRIGPFVFGRGTPCLQCLAARLLSNAGAAAQRRAVALQYQDEIITGDPPRHPVFDRMCAALFTLELERLALRRGPATLGGVLETSFVEPTTIRRELLRVPGCIACARPVPPQLAWNTLLDSPEVKSGPGA